MPDLEKPELNFPPKIKSSDELVKTLPEKQRKGIGLDVAEDALLDEHIKLVKENIGEILAKIEKKRKEKNKKQLEPKFQKDNVMYGNFGKKR